MEPDDGYLVTPNHSVMARGCPAVRDAILAAYGPDVEPAPSRRPVLVVGRMSPPPPRVVEGTLLYRWPDHADEFESLVGLARIEPRSGLIDPVTSRLWEAATTPGHVYSSHEQVSPDSVTATQVRLWLYSRGISLDAVQAAIDAIPDPYVRGRTLIQWEYAPYIERSHPLIHAIAGSLSVDVDQAFREAASL